MEKLKKYLSIGAYYVMLIILFTFTISQTFALIDLLLPGDGIMQYTVAVVFDGGVLLWLMMYEYKADSSIQRFISLFMIAFDIIGVGAVVFSELLLGGQELVTVDVPRFGQIAILVIGTVVLTNLAALVAFPILSQKSLDSLTMGSAQDDILALARQKAVAKLEGSADRIAESLSIQMEHQVGSDLDLKYKAQQSQDELVKSKNQYQCIAITGKNEQCKVLVSEPVSRCGIHKRQAS